MKVFTISPTGHVIEGAEYEVIDIDDAGKKQLAIITGTRGDEIVTKYNLEYLLIGFTKKTKSQFSLKNELAKMPDRIFYARVTETGATLARSFGKNACSRSLTATAHNTVEHSVLCVFEFEAGDDVANCNYPLAGGIVGYDVTDPIFGHFPGDIVSCGLIEKTTSCHISRVPGIRRMVAIIRKDAIFCIMDINNTTPRTYYMWDGESLLSQSASAYSRGILF